MAIKPTDQLADSGAVIGYRPELQHPKDINSYVDSKLSQDRTSQDTEKYSKTIESYLENQPNLVIIDLDDTMHLIDESIERLTEEFNNKNYKEFSNLTSLVSGIENNNISYINDFLSYHKDISKSQIPEIIFILEEQKQRLDIMIRTLKQLYYGNSNITLEECTEKDTTLANVIKNMDSDNKGLNYLTLSYDSKINKSILIYSSKVNSATIQLEEVAYTTDNTNVTNKILLPTIQHLFQELETETQDRISSYQQQNKEVIEKTLYNYYNKRKALKEYYDVIISCAEEGSYLLTKFYDYDKEVEEAIQEVNKVNLGNVYYLNKLESLLHDKQQLRSIYATISYN